MDEFKFKDWQLTAFWISATVAALLAGFVFGWCWRDRPGALARVSILDAMTAVGTVGATVSGVAIAAVGYSQRKREELKAAVRYSLSQADVLISANSYLKQTLALKEAAIIPALSPVSEELVRPLTASQEKLQTLDADRLFLAFPDVGNDVYSAKTLIAQAIHAIETSPREYSSQRQSPILAGSTLSHAFGHVMLAERLLNNSWNRMLASQS